MSKLIDDINKYKESFKKNVPEDVQETMLEATKKLQEEQLSSNALKVGDHIDSFTMLDSHNQLFDLDVIMKNHDYIVLSFYRGAWCPYCNLELQQLRRIVPELKILNAQLYALSPQTPDLSLSQIEEEQLGFEVLCDKNNALARKFGLVFTLDETLRPIYETFGIDILQSNKNGTFDLPMPATFVINKNYEVIYAFVDEDYTKRCEPQEILQIIKKDFKNRH